MTRAENDDWTISIFLPEPQVTVEAPDESVDKHSIRDLMPRFGRVAEVDGRSVEAQWRKTVDTLMRLSSSISERTKDWRIDEVEVGLTLSAKGELLFIAEAGAEASIKFVLKKRLRSQPESA
jgi:hypothetical protein